MERAGGIQYEHVSTNMKEAASFRVPLYDITSSEKLEELVIGRLLPAEEDA
jgi:hypothetical protein